MSNDLFGNLGGLMKGLSGLMPQDDPNVRLVSLSSQLSELQTQETALLAAVGEKVFREEPGRFPEQELELVRIREKITAARTELAAAQQEQKKHEQAAQQEEELHTCPRCGCRNPDGVKFCRECGTKLGPVLCRACGAVLSPGTKFCGTCGAGQEG